MGRAPYRGEVELIENGQTMLREVEFFGWERLDRVDELRREFGL